MWFCTSYIFSFFPIKVQLLVCACAVAFFISSYVFRAILIHHELSTCPTVYSSKLCWGWLGTKLMAPFNRNNEPCLNMSNAASPMRSRIWWCRELHSVKSLILHTLRYYKDGCNDKLLQECGITLPPSFHCKHLLSRICRQLKLYHNNIRNTISTNGQPVGGQCKSKKSQT